MASRGRPDSVDVRFGLLLKKYTPLINRIVNKMGFLKGNSLNGMVRDDAKQAAMTGLWQASLTFDRNKVHSSVNDPFSFWARVCMHHEIGNEVRRCQWFRGSRHRAKPWICSMRSPEEHDIDSDDEFSQEWLLWVEDLMASNPEDLAADEEWLDKIDDSVGRMDARRRNTFQGVMRHDAKVGCNKDAAGRWHCETWGISSSRLSQLRADIRKTLKARLN